MTEQILRPFLNNQNYTVLTLSEGELRIDFQVPPQLIGDDPIEGPIENPFDGGDLMPEPGDSESTQIFATDTEAFFGTITLDLSHLAFAPSGTNGDIFIFPPESNPEIIGQC